MLASSFKRTKVVATLGPASNSPSKIEGLMNAGVNAFRFNMAHAEHNATKQIIELIRAADTKLQRPTAVIMDIQGPKLRVASLVQENWELTKGQALTFYEGEKQESAEMVPIHHDISGYVAPGQSLFLKDGHIKAKITHVEPGRVRVEIENGGTLSSNQGINLPDADLAGDIITDKDWQDIEFAVSAGADYLALSFVQTATDIKRLKDRLAEMGSDIKVIAKIETKAAVKNLNEIISISDGVMVARGDLAIETRPEDVPVIQRQIINLSRARKKISIVATQMFESMIHESTPTRAEVSDVAGAVMEGADAVMLSSETAIGKYPVEAVKIMKRVIRSTEESVLPGRLRRDFFASPEKENAISAAAVTLAFQIDAKVIIAESATGKTARNISSLRPPMPIVMVTHNPRVYHQLAIVWGGKSYLVSEPKTAGDAAIKELRDAGNVEPGDIVVIASGRRPGIPGGTDTVQIREVPAD